MPATPCSWPGPDSSLELQVDTVSLLTGHLRRYVTLLPSDGRNGITRPSGSGGGGGESPLLLSRCIDTHSGDIVEPLPLLIGCLYRMLDLGRENLAAHKDRVGEARGLGGDSMLDDDESRAAGAEFSAAAETLQESLNALEQDLRRLSSAVSSSQLEDFGLDKMSAFSLTGETGSKGNLATAALLCGSYEALMQGALLPPDHRATATAERRGGGGKRLHPRSSSVRDLLALFDRRQTLLELVRPSFSTLAQQRGTKKAGIGGGSSSSGHGFGSGSGTGDGVGGDSEGVGNAGFGGGSAGSPGFSIAGSFGLTLYPGGMPCLGISFVEDMLTVLNNQGGDTEEQREDAEGDTEQDVAVVGQGSQDPSTLVGVILGDIAEIARGMLITVISSPFRGLRRDSAPRCSTTA